MTIVNKYGLFIANWENHKHPDNPEFMQVVFWTADFNPATGAWKAGYRLSKGVNAKFTARGECKSVEEFKAIIESL